MALKAYKHLTDGEVKIVEEDSAEEAGLLADVVHGASYIQLQTDGTREEVAAAQGTSLWTDVTSDLGGGGSSAQVFEVTDLVIPSGTDWNATPHVIGSFTAKITDMIRWRIYLEWDSNHPLDGVSLLIGDGNFGREADLSGDGALYAQVINDSTADQAYNLFGAPDTSAAPPAEDTFDVVLTTNPGTTEDITVTARVVVEIV